MVNRRGPFCGLPSASFAASIASEHFKTISLGSIGALTAGGCLEGIVNLR
jgi:hypothetical protein